MNVVIRHQPCEGRGCETCKRGRRLLTALETLDQRDAIVREAFALGLSKHEIHRRSGIARSTIDRILKDPS